MNSSPFGGDVQRLQQATLRARCVNPKISATVSRGKIEIVEVSPTRGGSCRVTRIAGPMLLADAIAYMEAIA